MQGKNEQIKDIVHTEKKARWNSDTKKFFDEAEDHSLVLNAIISLSCKSQTGESFEELVNALNDEKILRKIKKINILDTTYLYRHFYSEFSKYTDVKIPTDWYMKNKKAIEQIKAEVELKCWATEIDSEDFRNCYKKIMRDFQGDENGNGVNLEFRDTVIAEAATNAYKHKKDRKQCIDFILEECAHLCSSFRSGGIIVYPMKLYSTGDYIIEKYSLDIKHISYRVSGNEENDKEELYKSTTNKIDGITETDIEAAVTNFMRNEATNMNFFVVDKQGKLIHSNFSLDRLINKKLTAEEIDKNAWAKTYEVIRTGKMFVGEEKGRGGRTYLSMKTPLRVNGEIEGAIGISIDVTDSKRVAIEKKRAMDLEFLNRVQQLKLKFQEEFTRFISQMAHDITSPLVSLEVFSKTSKDLPKDQQCILRGITSSIKNIADELLQKYKYSQKELDFPTQHCVLVALTLFELLNQKKMQYRKDDIKINLFYDPTVKYTFINIDQSEFSRIISELIDRTVKNLVEKKRIINVRFIAKNSDAIIEILSSSKLVNLNDISDIAEKSLQGRVTVSNDSKGSKITVTFPLAEQPSWISTQINVRKDSIVMVLDNDETAQKQWERLFKNHMDTVKLKFCSDGQETSDFVDSLSNEEKQNVCALINYESTYSDSEDILSTVLQCDLVKQSVIMTSAYNDNQLQEVIAAAGAKMLPKQFLKGINVIVN